MPKSKQEGLYGTSLHEFWFASPADADALKQAIECYSKNQKSGAGVKFAVNKVLDTGVRVVSTYNKPARESNMKHDAGKRLTSILENEFPDEYPYPEQTGKYPKKGQHVLPIVKKALRWVRTDEVVEAPVPTPRIWA